MFRMIVVAWVIAGAACWLRYDAKYFNRDAMPTLGWLVVNAVAGPLAWLRLLIAGPQ